MGLGLGPFELVLILAVMLLMFGARRLPELAGGMGKGIREFKRALSSVDEPAQPAHTLSAPPAGEPGAG